MDIVHEITQRYQGDGGAALTAVLQDVQAEYNYLPEEALFQVAEKLNVPLSQVYTVATFYKAFSLQPLGKHLVSVCLGTACHVRGGARLVDKLKRSLGIEPGETTADQMFTLETVNCLGACALGPVVVVDGEYHGKMTVAKVDRLFDAVREKEAAG